MLSIGACGLMNAVGNLRPNILSEMCEALWDKNNERGYFQLGNAEIMLNNYKSALIAFKKSSLVSLG